MEIDSNYDVLVIGGGINGVGIASDAAGRGLKVLLCEKNDLASATSSASTKLIHGGLRYLEQYDFLLVRKALQERELLYKLAPHIVRPLAFHIPWFPHLRPKWLIRMGLFLYDNLTRRVKFPSSRQLRFDSSGPFVDSITHGFEYWDAQVDDARLVVLTALQARQQGAQVRTGTACSALETFSQDGQTRWQATLENKRLGSSEKIVANLVVNASGPWVGKLFEELTGTASSYPVRLVKGSHIVVPRLDDGYAASMLQNDDGRIVFVIPYQQHYSLIGTTESEFKGSLDDVKAASAGTDYLVQVVNKYYKKKITREDIVHSFAGIRPLVGEENSEEDFHGNSKESARKSASKVSRDYKLIFEETDAPMLSVYGGKVTTYRLLAEQAVDKLQRFFPDAGASWTRNSPLPGGDFSSQDLLREELLAKYEWLAAECYSDMLDRWLHSYGHLSFTLLGDAKSAQDLGESFGSSLYQLEVDYLVSEEWARCAEDILWRRSKLGLRMPEDAKEKLEDYVSLRVAKFAPE